MDTFEGRVPNHAAAYRRAVTVWEQPRRAALEQAALLAARRSYRVHAREMAPLIAQEGQALFSWQAGTLGIPATRQPDARDCDRFAEGIAALD
jgi:ferric-dicitrate binding protein FerR (iron transport regulator)